MNPGAVFNASLFVLRTNYHLLSFSLARTDLKGTATSFSPMPRNPPTPMITTVTRPSLSIRMSSTPPILLSDGRKHSARRNWSQWCPSAGGGRSPLDSRLLGKGCRAYGDGDYVPRALATSSVSSSPAKSPRTEPAKEPFPASGASSPWLKNSQSGRNVLLHAVVSRQSQ